MQDASEGRAERKRGVGLSWPGAGSLRAEQEGRRTGGTRCTQAPYRGGILVHSCLEKQSSARHRACMHGATRARQGHPSNALPAGMSFALFNTTPLERAAGPQANSPTTAPISSLPRLTQEIVWLLKMFLELWSTRHSAKSSSRPATSVLPYGRPTLKAEIHRPSPVAVAGTHDLSA